MTGNSLKNIIFSSFIFTATLLLSGCKEDPCEKLSCENGGVCNEGKCSCPDGYAGPTCSIKLDPCLQKPCNQEGTQACVAASDGTAICECKPGYEGNLCQTKWEEKFTGNFISSELCNGQNLSYTMMITPGPNPRQITMANFNDRASQATTAKVVANLINGSVFDIYEQFMAFGKVSGAGTIDADRRITLNFQIINGTDTLVCNGILFPN